MATREERIQLAINSFLDGTFPSKRAAATAYGIPESTLRDRLSGRTNSVNSHKFQQRLPSLQEEFLVEWILEEALRGFPPSHARTRDMAERVARINGDLQPIGQHWVK